MHSYIITIALLFLFSCTSHDNLSSHISLTEWEIKKYKAENSTWSKTEIVPWEESKVDGFQEYDGYGVYRAKFEYPGKFSVEEWQGATGGNYGPIALFIPCLDDADETRLNGQVIGVSGFPAPGREYRSGVRVSRLYLIPFELLKSGSNTIEIAVYDATGLGGFCYNQNILLGSYYELVEKQQKQHLKNDIPRIVSFTFLLFLALYLAFKIAINCSHFSKYYTLKYIVAGFIAKLPALTEKQDPGSIFQRFKPKLSFIRHITDVNRSGAVSESELLAKYFIAILISMCLGVFQVSELTFKYLIVDFDTFWASVPAICFAVALALFLNLVYSDIYGSGQKKSLVLFAMAVITHPLLALTLVILLSLNIFNPYRMWNQFTEYGLVYLGFANFALFIAMAVNLGKCARKVESIKWKKILIRESYLRAIVILGMLLAVLLWFSPKTLPHYMLSFLVLVFFYALWLMLNLSFNYSTRLRLPLVIITREEFDEKILIHFPGLNERQIEISWYVYNRWSRDDIIGNASTVKRLGRKTFNKEMSALYNSIGDRLKGIAHSEKYSTFMALLHELIGEPSFPENPPK